MTDPSAVMCSEFIGITSSPWTSFSESLSQGATPYAKSDASNASACACGVCLCSGKLCQQWMPTDVFLCPVQAWFAFRTLLELR